jgi:WD40 repeat protein
MTEYKIFISSPGDVGRERHLAEQVIRRVAAQVQDRVQLQPYFWEYEPMEATRDYQENIPLTSAFDLVICILWKRLGSPLGVKHQRPDGGRWQSGTEFELLTALEAKQARGAPDIFIFKNDTKPTFEADEEGVGAKTERDLAQWKALIAFLKTWCEGVQEGQRVFTAALNRYQALDQFEQVLEKLLVGKLNERFPPAPDRPDAEASRVRLPVATWTQGSPFRGLEAFQFAHAPVFCGRTRAIGEVLERLRRKAAKGRPFVLILGASGSGKSSLAMAGVLPLLVKPGTIEGVGLWRRVVFRPGAKTEAGDLFDRLAAALVRREQEGEGLPELVSGSASLERLAADLRAEPKAAALLVRGALDQAAVLYREAEAGKLRGWMEESRTENRAADVERYGRMLAELTPRAARLALVIDQAEELFTADELNRRPDLRAGFAVALDALAASGVVYVLATLRSDFYAQLQQLPAFVDLKDADGQFDLLPAQPAEVAQMIRQPALAAGLRFEQDAQTQEGLDEVLADQVKAEPRLLPLLEFALDELYKRRTAGGVLSFEAYRVHLDGSIVRALAKRADATLAGLPDQAQQAFRSVMRRLATTVDAAAAGSANGPEMAALGQGAGGSSFQRQRVPYDQLTTYPPGAKALVDAFVAARLLVVEAGKAADQTAEVTVAHEALFEHWAALKKLLLAERDDLILPRARVAASYERWRAQDRAGDFLLPPGKQLSEAEHLLAKYGEELTPELKAYIVASMAQAHAQQKRRQRLLVGALVVFALLAVAASGAAIFAYSNARRTKQTLTDADFLQARDMVEQGKMDDALAHLARAVRILPQNRAALDRIFTLLAQRSFLLPASAPVQFNGRITSLRFTPEGRCLVATVSGATAQVFDARSGQPATAPLQHDGSPVQMAELSPDAKLVATACGGSSEFQECDIWPHQRGMPIGDRQDTPGSARVWEVATGKLVSGPLMHDKAVLDVRFNHDGTRIVTASDDQTARVWDVRTGEPHTPPLKHEGRVLSAQFSPDDKRVIAASEPFSIWDAETGKQIASLAATHALAVEYSPDGKRIALVLHQSGEEDTQDLEIIDAETCKKIGEAVDSAPVITSINFTPDAKGVLESFAGRNRNKDNTGGIAETEVETGESGKSRSTEGTPVQCAIVAPRGETIYAGLDDRTLCLWRRNSELEPLVLPIKFPGTPFHLAFDPSGASLVVFFNVPETAETEKTWVQFWNLPTVRERSEVKSVPKQTEHPTIVEDRIEVEGRNEVITDTSRDGQRVLKVMLGRGLVTIADVKTGQPIGTSIHQEADYGGFFGMQTAKFSPDGRLVATGEGGDFRIGKGFARIWDARTGKALSAPLLHHNAVTFVALTGDNKRLVTLETNLPKHSKSWARMWDVRSGTPLTEVMPGRSFDYSEGSYLAVLSPERGQLTTFSSKEGAEDSDFAEVWDVAFPLNARMPEWLPRLAEIVGGFQLNAQTGLLEPLPERWQKLEALRKELAGSKAEDAFTAFGKWFLAEPNSRTISPFSKVTVAEYIDRCVASGEEDSYWAESLAAGNDELMAKIDAKRAQLSQPSPPAATGLTAPAASAALATRDLTLPPAAAASPSPSPAETPVETTPAPARGSDATPQGSSQNPF